VRLVECVPNYSDGRRPAVIGAIRDAIAATPGAYVLDTHVDPWHNRSVVTFVAAPEAVADAAFAGAAKAAELIDLTAHAGVHPRLGAADVTPFVPLPDRGTAMPDCVALAHALGERVGRELGVPVYLYEHAAARPDRANLADVRRGGSRGRAVGAGSIQRGVEPRHGRDDRGDETDQARRQQDAGQQDQRDVHRPAPTRILARGACCALRRITVKDPT